MKNKKELEILYDNYEDTMQKDIVTKEVLKLGRTVIEETENLKKKFTTEQNEKLEYIFEKENERDSEEIKEVFIWAFALATRLLLAGQNTEGDNYGK